MSSIFHKNSVFIFFYLFFAASARAYDEESASLPLGFADKKLSYSFTEPTGLCFAPDGRMFVWEKAGKVWVVENGSKSQTPFLDISEEVNNSGDRGLTGFALDPNFLSNGYVYLLYGVDRHYLFNYGLPSYDPQVNDFTAPTIGRVTRYTANASDGLHTVDPNSRAILLGEDISTGIPILDIHSTGQLVFGSDGSLLVSCGDGTTLTGSNTATKALNEGIIQVKEDINSYKSQLIDSYCGKILRIDPQTGDGLTSNPFYDPLRPRAAQSRVWVYGLRNPYRFNVVQSSSSTALRNNLLKRMPKKAKQNGQARLAESFQSNPGKIIIGDVGNNAWEEINVSQTGGENFGWPVYEGMNAMDTTVYENLDAPNPLYVAGQCAPHFTFQDLLTQDTLNTPSWPNPCDPLMQITASMAPIAMHTRPLLDWGHTGPARVPIYDLSGNAAEVNIEDPNSPILGNPFLGNCSMGGVQYKGSSYPSNYMDTYFHVDFGAKWIKQLIFASNGALTEVVDFYPNAGPIVHMDVDPISGDLFFLYFFPGEVHQISYYPNNIPPLAIAEAAPSYGSEPLTVNFDALESIDPEGKPLLYEWNFGPGVPLSRLAKPARFFPTQDFSSQATIIAHVFELNPPAMDYDPEVIRDGVYPLLEGAIGVHFPTFYGPQSAKGQIDWLGYEFAQTMEFRGLNFQQGNTWTDLGGWLDNLKIQVRNAGVWSDVLDAVSNPPYTGINSTPFEIYEFSFAPVQGDAIRIYGTPGGPLEFFTVAELVVYGLGMPANTAARIDVGLTVTDEISLSDSTTVPVWLNNTPPQISINFPTNGLAYDKFNDVVVTLDASLTDLEQPVEQLACSWQAFLHHDNHTHPEPAIVGCNAQILLSKHDEGEGELLFWELVLTASDSLGLSASQSIYFYPQTDCNLNGYLDEEEIHADPALDMNMNGMPDACEMDCNANGLQDPFDLAIGFTQDCNGNGTLDACDISSGLSTDVDFNGFPDECENHSTATWK